MRGGAGVPPAHEVCRPADVQNATALGTARCYGTRLRRAFAAPSPRRSSPSPAAFFYHSGATMVTPRVGRVSRLVVPGFLAVLWLVPSLAVAAGSGGHSYTAWDAQGAPPGAPQSLTATVSGSTVSLNWLPPTTGGVPASYLLEASLSAGGPVLTSMPVAGTPLAVPNVPNGTYF